ncbi:MAG: UDP-2,3-diacylglucosamine diphosphatase [Candidatus Omnitrophica bacterium]|nr:UDP-2,3-diacylglucosamine diphosphatase [Candidatus Omnitrophota bacterium]
MKIFISDLHLGDGSRSDDFHRDKELLDFFDFAENQAEELIILGDLFELWQADLDRVIFTHSDVINRLFYLKKKIKVTYVIGNHDYIPFIKFVDQGNDIRLEYRDSEYGIVGEHGHRYDIFNRYRDPLLSIKWPSGKHLALFIASLEKLIHPNVDTWTKKAIEGLDDFLQKAIFVRNKVTPTSKEYFQRGGHFGEFEQAVKNHIKSGAKIVIFGHIHKCQLNTIENGIYANCGAWVDDAEPTYVACHKEKIELKEALTHKLITKMDLNV